MAGSKAGAKAGLKAGSGREKREEAGNLRRQVFSLHWLNLFPV
jgi:hypothetical protein